MNAKETLKVYFGYDSFREGQEDIIDTIIFKNNIKEITKLLEK